MNRNDHSSNAKKILIIDDEPDIHGYLTSQLTDVGYRVFSALDWKGAIKLLAVENPDLIILDIMMPEVDGWLITHTLKKEMQSPVLIVIYSVLDSPQDITRGMKLGANAYVPKSAPIVDLLQSISQLLNN